MSFRSGLIRVGRTTIRLNQFTRPNFRNGSRNAPFSHKNAVHTNSVVSPDASPIKRVETFTERLNSAASTKQLSIIHTYYPALVAELANARALSRVRIPSPLSQQQLIIILDTLGSSGRPADLKCIGEMISDMPTVFGMEPTIEIHTVIIRALIRHGNIHSVLRWLQSMPLRAGHITPTLEQFHLFLEACTELATFKFMRNVIKSMRQTGCKPSNETFKILIRARWTMASQDSLPHLVVFSAIIDDIKQEGLPHDPSVVALLYDGYAERNHMEYAVQIHALYQSRFPDVVTSQQLQEDMWSQRLSDKAHREGIKGALALFRTMEPDGCVASPQIFKAMLRYSRNLNDLRYLEEALGTQASAVHWSLLINNVVRTGRVSDAVSMYEESKKNGIRPDAALVAPIIKALCRSTVKPPTESAIDQALSIYRDLAEVAPPSLSQQTQKESYAEHSVGPDANIYQTLLRGLASSSNLKKYFGVAKSLMDDMQSRSLSMNDSLTTTSIIVLLMRNSSNLSEAFDVYRRLCSALDEKGYAVVLNAFCKLSFGDDVHIPSLTRYFEIVRDMRQAGHTMTAEVYTILLRQLGIVATRMNWPDTTIPADFRYELITATRRTHDLLTLDASVSPDAHVWNQLMDTYQRLGCFGDSYRVWDMMYLTGRFDHISVSIILDACGHAGAWQVARQICANLFKDNFLFNQRNWNTWLECLCRLGKLDHAVKCACMEMGRNQEDVAPDAESMTILLKFAREVNRQAEVLSRIKLYLPELWTSLPAEMRQP